MRLEGFVSLISCVMFLVVLGVGFCALQRELRLMLPSDRGAQSVQSAPAAPPAPSR